MTTDLANLVPTIEFTWTITSVIWVIVLVIATMLVASGLGRRSKRVAVVLSVLGSLAVAWAVLADLGEVPPGQMAPDVNPMLLSLWGLGILVLLPALFLVLGGARGRTFHPTIAPLAYVVKIVTFLASALSIVGFYLQHVR